MFSDADVPMIGDQQIFAAAKFGNFGWLSWPYLSVLSGKRVLQMLIYSLRKVIFYISPFPGMNKSTNEEKFVLVVSCLHHLNGKVTH